MDLNLAGKKALVVGGSKGIGRATSIRLAKEGAYIAICGRNKKNIEITRQKLKKEKKEHFLVQAEDFDVGNQEHLNRWIERSAKELGGIDILIYLVSAQSFDWSETIHLDLMTCIHTVDQCLPYIKKSKSGAIVTVASIAASLKVPSYKPYSALKAALISYTGSLSAELILDGIRVNAVSPAEVFFEGGFWDRMRVESSEFYESTISLKPMKRFATIQEVADPIVFLASPLSSFITGVNLIIDGGSSTHVRL